MNRRFTFFLSVDVLFFLGIAACIAMLAIIGVRSVAGDDDVATPKEAAVAAVADRVYAEHPIIRRVVVTVPDGDGDWKVASSSRIYEDIDGMIADAAGLGYDHGIAWAEMGVDAGDTSPYGVVPSWSTTQPTRFPPLSTAGHAVGAFSLIGPDVSIEAAFTLDVSPKLNQDDARIVSKGFGRQLNEIEYELTAAYDRPNNRHFPRARFRLANVTTTIQAKNVALGRGIRYAMRLVWDQNAHELRLFVNNQLVRKQSIDQTYRSGSTWPVTIGGTVDTSQGTGFSGLFEGTVDHVIMRSAL